VAQLPTGTVTFLFTDIEGSTRLWEEYPEVMRGALARHDALAAALVERHVGTLVMSRGEGDSLFAVFARATDALAAACAFQQALHAEPWPPEIPLRVRMALHTGEADLRDGGYYGSEVNRCARLRAVAHGGQVLLSRTTYDLVRDALPEGAGLRDLGQHRLQDLARPEQVFQLLHPALRADFPPLLCGLPWAKSGSPRRAGRDGPCHWSRPWTTRWRKEEASKEDDEVGQQAGAPKAWGRSPGLGALLPSPPAMRNACIDPAAASCLAESGGKPPHSKAAPED
jgi:class 3 adenylate cyclase